MVDPKASRIFRRVTAFIDWNSQLLLTGIDCKTRPVEAARAAFGRTARRIAGSLSRLEPNGNFRVSLRLYHGWYKGWEPSPNRKAANLVIGESDFTALSDRPNVVFAAEVGFGDCLLSALPRRIHEKVSIHLPNTLRVQTRGKPAEEKMVDTALAADVMVSAYEDPDDWILVAAEDDDLVPPLFAAEAIIEKKGSRVLLLRQRRQSKNYLKLDEILLGETK